MIIASIRPNQA